MNIMNYVMGAEQNMRTVMLLFWVVVGFIIVDCVTGFVTAAVRKKLKSSAMRIGMSHKLAEILCMIAGLLIDACIIILRIDIGIRVTILIEVYLAAMEARSVFENLKKMNNHLFSISELKEEVEDGIKTR